MKMYPLIHQKKWLNLSLFLLFVWVGGFIPHPVQGQQILKDVIIGEEAACPGLSNEYRIDFDIYFPMNIQWRIIEGPGQIAGSDQGEKVTVQWSPEDKGFTKLVMFAVSYYPPVGLVDTITIHVDKDLNRINMNCIEDVVMDFGRDCERFIDFNELLPRGAKIMCRDDFDFTLELGNIRIPNPVPKRYNGETFVATLTHKETGQFCRSNVTLGDFTGPELFCKNDTVLCSDPRVFDPKNNLFGQPEVIADCDEQYTLKVNEYQYVNVEDDPYIEGYIERVWRATDENGNYTDCRDTVFLRKVIFDDIQCPEDAVITCDSMELLDEPHHTGTPTFDGMSIFSEDPYCKVYASYEDESTPGCGGSQTIIRTWTITSFEGESYREKTCTQIIEVVDTTGPKMRFDESEYEMEAHEDLSELETGVDYPTFYMNAILDDCKAEGDFPLPQFVEDCSTSEEMKVTIRWNEGEIVFDLADENPDIRFRNLTIGKYMVEYSAYDDCGNFGKDTIVLVFKDKKPPVIVLNDDLTVSLTDQNSFTWGNVSSFDRGTYDNCALEVVLARRVDWETGGGYIADPSIPNPVREYYDEFREKIEQKGDSCLVSLAEYGWTDKVPFDCADVCEEGILVEFLAIDAFCNYSKLVTRVRVSDQTKPVISQKLPDISMNCYTYQTLYKEEIDKGNTDIFGSYVTSEDQRKSRELLVMECSDGRFTPYKENTLRITDGLVADNCSMEISETINENISTCGEGWIERIFTISNPCDRESGGRNTIQVIQRINITKDCKLRQEDFVLPYTDTTVYHCGLTDVPASGPELKRAENCKDLGITYTDLVLKESENKEGVCYTIKRTWEVSDWCEADPYYIPEFVQYIYISNTEAPEIWGADQEDICIDRGCDFIFEKSFNVSDDCTPDEDIDVTWKIERQNQNTWESLETGKGTRIQSIRLGTGDYRLIVEAVDECHNKTRKTSRFNVGYCGAMSIRGPESITFNLNSRDDVLRLSDIPYEINHPCPDAEYEVRIRYKGEGLVDNGGKVVPPLPGATSLEVNCDKIGSNLIELWIVDEAGNADYYSLTMVVKDPRGICPGGENRLVGRVQMPNGNPLPEVTMRLNGPVTEIRKNVTSGDGRFDLGTLPETDNILRVRAEKQDHPAEGISAFDALQIYQFATGRAQPRDPYIQLAADLDEDGQITVMDVLLIQRFLLNRIDHFPGQQWFFLNNQLEQEVSVRRHQEYRSRLYFVGVKKGDVDYSAGIRSSRMAGLRQDIRIGEPEQNQGMIRLPVYIENATEIESLQISLTNNNSQSWIAVESGRLTIRTEDYRMTEDELDLVWIQTDSEKSEKDLPEFYLIFDATEADAIESENIELASRLQPEVFSDNQLKERASIRYPHRERGVVDVSAPYPNPFGHQTRFDITGDYRVSLDWVEVYDVAGKSVHKQKVGQAVTEFTLDGQSLPGNGFYIIRFIFEDHVINKKLYYTP